MVQQVNFEPKIHSFWMTADLVKKISEKCSFPRSPASEYFLNTHNSKTIWTRAMPTWKNEKTLLKYP